MYGKEQLLNLLGKCQEEEAEELNSNMLIELADIVRHLPMAVGPDGADVINTVRLQELSEADRDGRCVVLRFKEGEWVYALRESWDGINIDRKKFKISMNDRVGKTVFGSHAAAEKAAVGFYHSGGKGGK